MTTTLTDLVALAQSLSGQDQPEVMVRKLALLDAVHVHPLGAVTLKFPLPPPAARVCLVGEME